YSTRIFRNPLEVTRANHRSAPRYEVGWYRRAIEIPANECWKGKRVILTIGAADFFTDCWCNGKHLGHHEGGYTPFEFDLTDALKLEDGRQRGVVVLRVEDPMDNSEQPVGKQWRWYTTTSGIWQTVFLEPRAATYIRCFRITPDIAAGTAHFAVECANSSDDCDLEISISPSDAGVQATTLEVRKDKAGRTINLGSLRLWDPNVPNIYDVILKLRRKGQELDVVRSSFGMRKIDFEL